MSVTSKMAAVISCAGTCPGRAAASAGKASSFYQIKPGNSEQFLKIFNSNTLEYQGNFFIYLILTKFCKCSHKPNFPHSYKDLV